MGRNLLRRIEIAWPVLDPVLRRRVIDEGLKPYLHDTAYAWKLGASGHYTPPRNPDGGSSAQYQLLAGLSLPPAGA